MTAAAETLRSGKGAHDENFPVASRLVHPRHRPAILAFYEFVRVADDIADHPSLPDADKLAFLDRLEASLLGESASEPQGAALAAVLAERGLSARHARDLLTAFRLDVTERRYETFDDLIDYCRFSAMPVGRYVLDVHGENPATWAANDLLCAALQIINHLQDCAKDFAGLDRVYIPHETFSAHGARVEDLGAPRATPALAASIHDLARRTETLLDGSRVFAGQIRDHRLALEVAVIQALAERLVRMLQNRDPLSERVHLGKAEVAALGSLGIVKALAFRVVRAPFARPAAADR